jgi:hypothetical protein
VASLGILAVGAALGPLPGVAALAAVSGGILIMRRPVLGAYVLVLCVPALSGLRRGLPVPGFRLSELLIMGIAALILVTAHDTPRWQAFDWVAFGYVVATGVLIWLNVVRAGDAFTADALATMLGPLRFFLLYRTLVTTVRSGAQRATALRLLILASIPVAVLTLLQQWNVGGARGWVQTLAGSDAVSAYVSTLHETPRATGPFPHWHNLAGYLLLILLVVLSLLHEPAQRVLGKRVLITVFALGLIALTQTASVAPMLGLLVGAILIASFVGRARKTLVWVGITAAIAALAFSATFVGRYDEQYQSSNTATESQTLLPQTISFRYEVWTKQYIPVIADNLLIGYGPNLPPRLFFGFLESLYITLLLRGGLILLVVYLLLMSTLVLRAWRSTRSDETGERVVARAVFVSVILLLGIDTIATYFLDTGPAPTLWALVGLMGLGLTHRSANREPAAEGPHPSREDH